MRVRVLVVDDQKISRLTLAGILGDAGHAVRVEGDGPSGLDAAHKWLPDVIILDVHMPGMDGFEVVERLKQDPVTESIPVIFLTGDPPTDELVVRGLDLGAYDFLSKGCSKAELLARVSAMNRIKRSYDELSAIARISDALLRSVDPTALGGQFTAEARKVFRADAALLGVERNGRSRVRVCDGLEVPDDRLNALLEEVGALFGPGEAAESRILDEEQVAEIVGPYLDEVFRSGGVASVRRGPSQARVVVLDRQADLLRPDVDGPLLRNLSSQAAIAIEHSLLNERAREQAEDLEQAMNERSRFFASLSHELRTPINAVIGYNHLLQEEIFGELSEQQREALEKANRSATHLLELVDDILDISKIEAGKMEISSKPVDLASLARDTATSIQIQATKKGIDLDVEVPTELEIETDAARVRQIVLNLLSNAVKFTDEGGVTLQLQERGAADVELKVIDTGRGIEPEDQHRIFDEFEQVRSPSGSSGTGTGLGLAISRRLAEMLGGNLQVESEPGEGSTFTLILPRRTPAPANEGAAASDGAAASEGSSAGGS